MALGSRRGQLALEAMTLMAVVIVLYGMLLSMGRMENQRMRERVMAKRAGIIAQKAADAIDHVCDHGINNSRYIELYTGSIHGGMRYRQENLTGRIVKGIVFQVHRQRSDSVPYEGAAYVEAPYFTNDSIHGKYPDLNEGECNITNCVWLPGGCTLNAIVTEEAAVTCTKAATWDAAGCILYGPPDVVLTTYRPTQELCEVNWTYVNSTCACEGARYECGNEYCGNSRLAVRCVAGGVNVSVVRV